MKNLNGVELKDIVLPNAKDIEESRGLSVGGSVQKLVDKLTLERSEPYIPLSSGELINSGRRETRIGSGEIVYKTPYAKKVYYTNMNYGGAPQRGSRWLDRMKADLGENILSEAAKHAGGRAEK